MNPYQPVPHPPPEKPRKKFDFTWFLGWAIAVVAPLLIGAAIPAIFNTIPTVFSQLTVGDTYIIYGFLAGGSAGLLTGLAIAVRVANNATIREIEILKKYTDDIEAMNKTMRELVD